MLHEALAQVLICRVKVCSCKYDGDSGFMRDAPEPADRELEPLILAIFLRLRTGFDYTQLELVVGTGHQQAIRR